LPDEAAAGVFDDRFGAVKPELQLQRVYGFVRRRAAGIWFTTNLESETLNMYVVS
jgi:hypothetical protein